MARKRARTSTGSFIADDPATPENEAYVDEKPKTKKKKASATVRYATVNEENGVFDLRCGEERFSGAWDLNRERVQWDVPAEYKKAMSGHHLVWSGRIMEIEEE